MSESNITTIKPIDYALIRSLLNELYEVYPKRVRPTEMKSQCSEKVLMYLREHGLIAFDYHMVQGGKLQFGRISITAHGIDFLQPDGGLSALAAPIIRISPESLAAIIDAALAARNVPAEERSRIQHILGIAGTEGMKVIVQRLIEEGIPRIFNIIGGIALA